VIKKFGRGIAGYQVSGSETLNWNMQFRKLKFRFIIQQGPNFTNCCLLPPSLF
jgi:hypothetical protein